jgi:hypothetical protein
MFNQSDKNVALHSNITSFFLYLYDGKVSHIYIYDGEVSRIDGASVTIILCLPVLIARRILLILDMLITNMAA